MLHVKWGRDVLHIPLPPLDTPLGGLRATLAEHTQLEVFKLVYKGAVMKEDSAPLSTYRLKEGATILLIGGEVGGETSRAESKGKVGTEKKTPQTEEATIDAIRAELETVRESVVPAVDAFVAALTSHTSCDPLALSTPSRPSQMDHARLSELLLQSLLRLDAMYVPGVDWPDARVQRKAAVKEVQGVLDRLDGAWAGR